MQPIYRHKGPDGSCDHRGLGQVVSCIFSRPPVHYNAVRGGVPPVRVGEDGIECALSEIELARYEKLRASAEWNARDG